jgi:hypothetical protein
VWADKYNRKNEKFFPGNMKYPAKHKEAHELLNFVDEHGAVYGYVDNNGDWINLRKLGAASNAKEVDGVTVIWCGLDEATRRLRVVGWYDDATVFGEPQTPTLENSR